MYNKISNIDGSAFDGIPQCTELWLYDNDLSHVRADTFEKLPQLVILDLAKNRILGIEPGTFTKLTRLKRLHLHRNRLATLRRDAFSSQHKTNLTLTLAINPLQCDSTMCWIKQAEQYGWITLNYSNHLGSWTKPDCGNYPDHTWDSITLSCPLKGNCLSVSTKHYIFSSTLDMEPPESWSNYFLHTFLIETFIRSGNPDENNENHWVYITGGVTATLLLFCIIIFLFLVKFESCLISCCNWLFTEFFDILSLPILSCFNPFLWNRYQGEEENLKLGVKTPMHTWTFYAGRLCLILQRTNNIPAYPHHNQLPQLPLIPSRDITSRSFQVEIPTAMKSLFNMLSVLVKSHCTHRYKMVKTTMIILKYCKLTYQLTIFESGFALVNSFHPTRMATNGHYLCEWFRITNMNVLEVHFLGLGLEMSFGSKLYLLVFIIETSKS